jgi:hypothetical protein
VKINWKSLKDESWPVYAPLMLRTVTVDVDNNERYFFWPVQYELFIEHNYETRDITYPMLRSFYHDDSFDIDLSDPPDDVMWCLYDEFMKHLEKSS